MKTSNQAANTECIQYAEAPEVETVWRHSRFSPPHYVPRAGQITEEEADHVVSCFCCRGAGVVSPYLLNKYTIMPAELSDPPVECRATGCMSGSKSYTANDGSRQFAPRFADGSLDSRVSQEECDFIAQSQREEARMLTSIAATLPKVSSQASVLRAVESATEPAPVKHQSPASKAYSTKEDVEAAAVSAAAALDDLFADIA